MTGASHRDRADLDRENTSMSPQMNSGQMVETRHDATPINIHTV